MAGHIFCNRCWDPIGNKKGTCVFGTTISAPDPSVREKEEDSTMSKGIHFVVDGKVYRTTTPEAKKILKSVIKGEPAILREEDEVAPVIALDGLSKEDATAAFLKIEVGE